LSRTTSASPWRPCSPRVRDPWCSFDRSLEVLVEARRRRPRVRTKSSLLLGLGETDEQAQRTLEDLRSADVDMVCIGQYLQPTRRHLPVRRWVTPERFAEVGAAARAMGFEAVASGPLVRTSYLAAELSQELGGPVSGDGAR
jgi:lipoic acid synthetase